MAIEGISPLGQAVARQRADEADLTERAGGASNPGEAFEGIMLRKMVQSLQATVQESGLWEGVTGGQIYEHFIEQALSDHLAQAGGIGIAELFDEPEGSRVNPGAALGAAGLEVDNGDATSEGSDEPLEADDGSRPLAELLPPQYDSWLNSPAAEQTLRASLKGGIEGGKLRSP